MTRDFTEIDIAKVAEYMNRNAMRTMFENILNASTGGSFPFLFPGEGSTAKTKRQPFIDVVETDKEIIATVEMPGLKKEDISINLTDENLEISTESKHEEDKQGKDYLCRERRSGSFYRSIRLPSLTDPNAAKASYNNGVLEVKIPKKEIKKKTSVKIE